MDSYTEMKYTVTPSDNVIQIPGKNVLHFSDGTLDLDELNESEMINNDTPVDPQKLAWMPWMWYYTTFAGGKALAACDYLGEFLADFFGITTPKYQYEITEYNRMKKEEEERQNYSEMKKTGSDIDFSKDYIITGPTTSEQYQYTSANTPLPETKC